MNELESILKKERPRCWAYVDMGKPFTYLDMVNEEYFCGIFEREKLYDRSLDVYNYFKRNGVLYAVQESLIRTLSEMYTVTKKYGSELDVYDGKKE